MWIHPSIRAADCPSPDGRWVRSQCAAAATRQQTHGVEDMIGGHAALVHGGEIEPVSGRPGDGPWSAAVPRRPVPARGGPCTRGSRCARRPRQPPGRSRLSDQSRRVVPACPKPLGPRGATAARTAWRPSQAGRHTRTAATRSPCGVRPGRSRDASGRTDPRLPCAQLFVSLNRLGERPRAAKRSVDTDHVDMARSIHKAVVLGHPVEFHARPSVVGAGYEQHRSSGSARRLRAPPSTKTHRERLHLSTGVQGHRGWTARPGVLWHLPLARNADWVRPVQHRVAERSGSACAIWRRRPSRAPRLAEALATDALGVWAGTTYAGRQTMRSATVRSCADGLRVFFSRS